MLCRRVAPGCLCKRCSADSVRLSVRFIQLLCVAECYTENARKLSEGGTSGVSTKNYSLWSVRELRSMSLAGRGRTLP